ncbi:hypothetical protein HAX54_005690 [Datura stramonium]|uniref:Uncharacterized protein n=1 Tax=Datura stramonium TaxID=4076 RepID=A0ABS8WTJ2_DATST|nr:hypothetical protein [Datura stramonium]
MHREKLLGGSAATGDRQDGRRSTEAERGTSYWVRRSRKGGLAIRSAVRVLNAIAGPLQQKYNCQSGRQEAVRQRLKGIWGFTIHNTKAQLLEG